ncbi:MAG TPA: DUF983 domain-containing protein [Edaphocola sp.]|nr:DUF983 domain-containing protein [Edaphocola sp.]
MSKLPSALLSILQEKCPNCRKGRMYKNKSIFPLKNMMDMPDKCEHCGQKMEIEPGFYYGTGYVSYGLTIALIVFNLAWYALFVGISFKDNSIFWFLGVCSVLVILLQPYIMRYSRVLYLYLFVQYNSYDQNGLEDGQLGDKELETSNKVPTEMAQ